VLTSRTEERGHYARATWCGGVKSGDYNGVVGERIRRIPSRNYLSLKRLDDVNDEAWPRQAVKGMKECISLRHSMTQLAAFAVVARFERRRQTQSVVSRI